MSAHTFFSTYFPAPKFLDMSYVGIDISPLTIRMMEITDRASLKVGKYAEANLTTPFVITEGDNKEVKDILKKWKKDYNLTYIKASLPEDKAYLFDAEIEFGTEAVMRSSIEFSLEENVPLSGPEVIFEYRLIGDGTKEGFVKVAVTVLPVGVVNSYLTLFHECGLIPISFVTEAQGLSRALIARGDLGTYLIVNIHHTKTSVFIISKGAVQFTSTVAIGSLDFVKTLQNQFPISQEEAEKIKEAKGFTRGEGQDKDILMVLIKTASLFREEIEKVYVYWNKHRVSVDKTQAIQKVILSGREANTLGFKEYLNQTLKVPTEKGNVWLNVTNFDNYIPPLNLATALNFGTAIGLALPENE